MLATRRSGSRSMVAFTRFRCGSVDRISKQPVELVAPPAGKHHRGRHRHLAGSEHGVQRQALGAVQIDAAAQPVGRLLGKIVDPRNGVEQRHHHQVRSPLLLDEDVEAEILLARERSPLSPKVRTLTVTGIISAVAPSSPMMPLWRSCFSAPTISVALPNLFGWYWLDSDHQDFAVAHRHIDGPEVEERVAEGEDALAIVIGDCAERR